MELTPMAGLNPDQFKSEAMARFDEAKHHHAYFKTLFEKRERAYRGVKAKTAQQTWRHAIRPPYAFNLLETVVANETEMGLRFEVRPSPHADMTPTEAKLAADRTQDVEDLLFHEHLVDEFDQKQRPLFLLDGIGGLGLGKTYWNYTTGSVKRQGVQNVDVHDGNGNVIASVPTIMEIQTSGTIRDHSTTEVIDPRDFIWHEAAYDLDPRRPGGMQHMFHRCWYSYEQLLEIQKSGFISNVEQVTETRDFTEEYAGRDKDLFNIDRTKNMIEVLEMWWFEAGEIYTAWFGNRDVILKPKTANPFWHGQYPFFLCSSMPNPFSLRGTSTIELIADLQDILWELSNQRLDNVELINNAIMLIRGDVQDPDAFEHYPGARWEVDDVQQVAPLAPPYQVAEVSLQAEALIKGDLQNVTSAAPFAGGAQTASVDQKTATGASIVMNAAQAQLAQKKYQAQFGLLRQASQRLKNCQQFYTGEKLVHVLGPEGGVMFKNIPIIDIQADYGVYLKAVGESEMRQERRAEASNFAQLMIGFAPIAAAAGKPLDVAAIIKWFADKWEIPYPEQFFAASPAALGAAGMGPGGPQGPPGAGPPGAPGAPQGPNLGVTADSAVDASSPSASGGLSMSPQVFLQRAQALAGGAQGGGSQ
jgi:hypothetical protein